MAAPEFRVITNEQGEGVTYTCGCPCTPTARPGASGEPGMEHCCCGKVHFVGTGAASALDAYLAERKAARKREPGYTRGTATVALATGTVQVAWAFPGE